MTIKPMSLDALPEGVVKPVQNKVQQNIEEFLESGAEAGEIETSGYANRESCRISYLHSIRRNRFPVSIAGKGERLFIIRKADKGAVNG